MSSGKDRTIPLGRVLAEWWRDHRTRHSLFGTTSSFMRKLCKFARESTPEQRRRRFGDLDFDFDHRVNTTGGTVSWRDRLIGTFTSEYQATDPALLEEMLQALNIDFRRFTFLDLGSGKGRALLIAAPYPFCRIMGIELIPALHVAAEDNIRKYKNASQQCFAIECICADARDFDLPAEPLVIYLFNPFLQSVLAEVVSRLKSSLSASPRPVCILYHNPLLRDVLIRSGTFTQILATSQYCILANREFVACQNIQR
jgi:SAM-dependent methyltransferase